jgi:hypothetical protein
VNSSSGSSQPRLLGRGGLDRSLYLAQLPDVGAWPMHLDEPEPHFVALLAMDATSVDARALARLADQLMNQGMVYLNAWGPGSEQVHDTFDGERSRRDETDDAFVVTDWFDEEDLDDAIWDAVFAVPADAYIETCTSVVAIVVDQSDWSGRVEAAFSDFGRFDENVLSRRFPG